MQNVVQKCCAMGFCQRFSIWLQVFLRAIKAETRRYNTFILTFRINRLFNIKNIAAS